MQSLNFKSVNQAFSKQSSYFDAYDLQNPILQWMRTIARNHVLNFLKTGDSMLELNAGTGLDACFFIAQKNIKVHATDLTDGMINELNKKKESLQLNDRFTIQQCSFTELEKITNGPYDYVFSNFGGLNCISDLKEVTQKLPALLNHGAYISWVIMPPVCPWEIITLLKGKWSYAFRRLKKRGTRAHLEGHYFQTYYFTPKDVIKALGKEFKLIDLQGIGCFTPPPQNEKFPVNYPILLKKLNFLDVKLSRFYPFNTWCDHFIITARYLPGQNKV